MFANRLRKNLKQLGKWAEREQLCCYRLYDADMPEYALAIDLYQGAARWAHVQEYAAPKSIDPDKASEPLKEALSAIPGVLGIPAEQIFLKVRQRQKGSAQYERLAERGEFHEVQEDGLRLLVNFTDYLDTGLSLEHRVTRRTDARRRRTSAFSICSAIPVLPPCMPRPAHAPPPLWTCRAPISTGRGATWR